MHKENLLQACEAAQAAFSSLRAAIQDDDWQRVEEALTEAKAFRDSLTPSPPAPAPSRPGLRIAIDGPAGAGKSTVARDVATGLGYTYIDTGAMYRAVAYRAMRQGLSPTADDEAIGALAEGLHFEFRSVGDERHLLVDGEDVGTLVANGL